MHRPVEIKISSFYAIKLHVIVGGFEGLVEEEISCLVLPHYPLILVPYDECVTYSVRPLTATVTNSTLIMCSHDQFIRKGRQSAVPLGYRRYVCEWRRRVWNGWRTSSGRRQLDPWSLRWYLLRKKL